MSSSHSLSNVGEVKPSPWGAHTQTDPSVAMFVASRPHSTDAISPYRGDPADAQAIIGEERSPVFFLDAPPEVCEARGLKGPYRKTRAGEIADFTGISAPYEASETAQVRLRTDQPSIEESVETLLELLRATQAEPPGATVGDGTDRAQDRPDSGFTQRNV